MPLLELRLNTQWISMQSMAVVSVKLKGFMMGGAWYGRRQPTWFCEPMRASGKKCSRATIALMRIILHCLISILTWSMLFHPILCIKVVDAWWRYCCGICRDLKQQQVALCHAKWVPVISQFLIKGSVNLRNIFQTSLLERPGVPPRLLITRWQRSGSFLCTLEKWCLKAWWQ